MENLTYISKYMTVIAGHSKSGFQAFIFYVWPLEIQTAPE